jgi:hypothetical protein
MKTAGYAIFFARTLPSTLYIHGGLSLSHAGTSAGPRTGRTVHGTRMHAIPPHARRCAEHAALFLCTWRSVDRSERDLKICCVGQQEPVTRRRGHKRGGRRKKDDICSAGRKQMWSVRADCGARRGTRCVFVCWRDDDVCIMEWGSVPVGVERWFERKHSDLRGEAKNHLDRSHFSVGTGVTRPRIWPQQPPRSQQRRELAMGARAVDGRRRVKKAILRPSSPKEEMRLLPRCVVGGS